MKKNEYIYWGISIALSLVALCISFVRTEPMDIELFGVLVSVLSILVVVLLGYQIYSVIDFKQKTQEMNENIGRYREENYKMQMITHFKTHQAVSMLYYDTKNAFEFVKHSLESINFGLELKQIDACEVVMQGAVEVCENGLILTKSEKGTLLELVYGIKDIESVKGYNAVRDAVNNAKIVEKSYYREYK